MKKQALRILSVLSLFAGMAASSLYAQSDGQLVAKVPFDFAIGGKTFSAGDYEVRTVLNHQGSLLIRTADGRSSSFALTHSVQSLDVQEQAKLVFQRHGDHYFLAQIWFGSESFGRELPESKSEMDLARGKANPEMTVLVASPPTRAD